MSRNYNFHNSKGLTGTDCKSAPAGGLQIRASGGAGFIDLHERITFGVIVCAVAMKFLPARIANPRQRGIVNPRQRGGHMLVVGKQPVAGGNLLEVFQWGRGQASGMDRQDFYSNGVGYQFYMQYSGLQNLFYPNTFTNQMRNFFYNPRVIYNW